jgi:D-alanine-D-alanine ligase
MTAVIKNNSKIRVGIIFGGKSMEHEISLMSATSVINAIDKEKFEIVPIGINKDGQWVKYNGPIELIESGKWEDFARIENARAESKKNEQSKLNKDAVELKASDNSLKSGKEVKQELKSEAKAVLGYKGRSLLDEIDVVFPVLHGPFGEDGTIQGLFEMINIPYAGCGVLASSLAMDKALSKEIFARAGLPICKHILVFKEEIEENIEAVMIRIQSELIFPLFIKPSNMGSSVGISKVDKNEDAIKTLQDLKKALIDAIKHDRRILIEEGISARELEVGIIGNYKAEASVVGEIIPSKEFYDYEAKYFDGGKSKMSIPADIPEQVSNEIRELAIKAYKAIDGSGFARIDFFLDKNNGKIYINEINTIPGFTKFSMFPSLWQCTGVTYKEAIERIIGLAIERQAGK